MKKRIRRFTPGDHEQVVRIAELLPEWFDDDARDRAIPIDLKYQEVFVCEGFDSSADRTPLILGFIALFIAEGRVNIGWMGVHPDYHRQGIGGNLIQAAEDYCQSIGVDELATYTLGDRVEYPPYESTRAFYQKHGFTIYQRSQTDNPGCPEEIKLKKRVNRPFLNKT